MRSSVGLFQKSDPAVYVVWFQRGKNIQAAYDTSATDKKFKSMLLTMKTLEKANQAKAYEVETPLNFKFKVYFENPRQDKKPQRAMLFFEIGVVSQWSESQKQATEAWALWLKKNEIQLQELLSQLFADAPIRVIRNAQEELIDSVESWGEIYGDFLLSASSSSADEDSAESSCSEGLESDDEEDKRIELFFS